MFSEKDLEQGKVFHHKDFDIVITTKVISGIIWVVFVYPNLRPELICYHSSELLDRLSDGFTKK